MSRKSPQRRPPCGKDNIYQYDIFFGGCIQHNKDADAGGIIYQNVTKGGIIYQNVTKVTGKGLEGSPTDPETPYPEVNGVFGECNGGAYTCGDGLNGEPACYNPGNTINVVPQGVQVRSGNSVNSFIPTSNTQSVAPCTEMPKGWKAVWHNKAWHGAKPLKDQAYKAAEQMCWWCNCMEVGYHSSATQTKYLACSGQASYTHYRIEGAYQTGTASGTTTINALTGNKTTTRHSASTFPTSGDPETDAYLSEFYAQEAVTDMFDAAGTTIGTIVSKYCVAAADLKALAESDPTTFTMTVEDNGSTKTVTVDQTIFTEIPFVTGYQVISIDMNGSYTIDSYGRRGLDSYGHLAHYELHVTDTSVNISSWNEVSAAHADGRYHRTERNASFNLGSPYTVAQVKAHLFELAKQWDLGDDARLPWQAHTGLTTGPLVTYNERGPQIPVLFDTEPEDNDLYDGSIKGAPTPMLVDRFWNKDHENNAQCHDPSFDCRIEYIRDYGDWSTSCGVPCATQWTTKRMQQQLPQGPFIGSNFFYVVPSSCVPDIGRISDDVLWCCKYVEQLIEKPSFDFSRPHSVDRLTIEASSERCVESVNVETKTLTLSDYLPNPTTIETGDTVFVKNVSGITDGVWTATKDGDYQITLNTLKASASFFPTSPFAATVTGIVGKMKWHGMPGLAGRVDIVAATSTSPVTCSLLEPSYLMNGDIVLVSGSRGMNLDNTGWVVTVLDSSNIVLNGSNGVSQSYSGSSAQMYLPFAPDWKWFDTLPKHEFVTLDFKSDGHRQIGEYHRLAAQSASVGASYNCEDWYYDEELMEWIAPPFCNIPATIPEPRPYQAACGMPQAVTAFTPTQRCLIKTPCLPSVVYWSPVAEPLLVANYPTNLNAGFGDVSMDSMYGPVMWHGILLQYVQDYLWQAPAAPCTSKEFGETEYDTSFCQWQEDNGGCSTDQSGDDDLMIPCIKYFAGRPFVEARTALPAGAPPFVRDMIGLKSLAELNTPNCPPGPVYPPPASGNYVYTSFAPTLTYIPYLYYWYARQGCVCSSGRFADEYGKAISCDSEVDI